MISPSIIVSARISFESVRDIPIRFQGVDFPIELALPSRFPMWQAATPWFDEMVAALDAAKLTCFSIHATHGKISHSSFRHWGTETCLLAERLGARVVTVHPDRAIENRMDAQGAAKSRLRSLQKKTSVVISVETFVGKDRVLTPKDIMDCGLPMTLDISHIIEDDQIMEIIRAYWRNIPVVHLSARRNEEQHLPVDIFCIRVVRTLVSLGWEGIIVLEYLPWHHYRLRSDLRLVREALAREIQPEELKPRNDAYRGCPEMWGHNAPEPPSDEAGLP